MNEEEKWAIEYLSSYVEFCLLCKERLFQEHHYKCIQTIINLAKKQQKEIENHTFNDKVVLETLKECVTKRSIRELIKEKAKTDTYNLKTIAVKDIEELLGE